MGRTAYPIGAKYIKNLASLGKIINFIIDSLMLKLFCF